MNRLFLSAAALLIILSNVLPCSIKDAEAKQAVKRKIHAVGYGVPASSSNDAPIDVRKQEAFVADFFYGVGNIAEQTFKNIAIKKSKDMAILSFHKRIGRDFGVSSKIAIDDKKLLVVEDQLNVNYKGQKIVIKDATLILPDVKSVKLPRYNRLPKKISGIEIKDVKWDDKEETFTVKLAYRYIPTKALAPSKRFDGVIIDASDTKFRASLTKERIFTSWGELIYDPSKILSKSVIAEQGFGEYTDSIEKAKAAFEIKGIKNPLVIRAKGIISDGMDIVISEEDASKILEADKDTGFLDEAKVVFVLK